MPTKEEVIEILKEVFGNNLLIISDEKGMSTEEMENDHSIDFELIKTNCPNGGCDEK